MKANKTAVFRGEKPRVFEWLVLSVAGMLAFLLYRAS